MNDKVKGIATPIVTILVMIAVAIGTALLVESSSNVGWAALGAIMIVFMLTGLIVIIELIVGIMLFTKKQSEYGLGIIYCFAGILGAGTMFSLITGIYNAFI